MTNKIYLILRYIIISTILLGISFLQFDKFDTFLVILILVLIINNQLRYFRYKDNDSFIFISILLEWLIASITYKYYGGILISYFILGFSDIFLLLNKTVLRYICIILGFSIFIYTISSLKAIEIYSYIISIISIIILSLIVEIQDERRENIEILYEQLKLSKQQLTKKNSELNQYSKSLKDLTLLKERNRISREIHDSVGHSLSTIIIQLDAIEKVLHTDEKRASEMILNLRSFSKSGLEDIRNVLKELKPKDYSEYEIILKIEELVNNFMELTDVEVNIIYSKEKYGVKEEVSLVLYRAIQEFLSNSIKHGKASKINIFINFEEQELIVSIKDNGTGTKKICIGMGLMSLKERVEEVNGNVSFDSEVDKGFFVRISFKGATYGQD